MKTTVFDVTNTPQEALDEAEREAQDLPENARAWWRVNVTTGEREALVIAAGAEDAAGGGGEES